MTTAFSLPSCRIPPSLRKAGQHQQHLSRQIEQPHPHLRRPGKTRQQRRLVPQPHAYVAQQKQPRPAANSLSGAQGQGLAGVHQKNSRNTAPPVGSEPFPIPRALSSGQAAAASPARSAHRGAAAGPPDAGPDTTPAPRRTGRCPSHTTDPASRRKVSAARSKGHGPRHQSGCRRAGPTTPPPAGTPRW